MRSMRLRSNLSRQAILRPGSDTKPGKAVDGQDTDQADLCASRTRRWLSRACRSVVAERGLSPGRGSRSVAQGHRTQPGRSEEHTSELQSLMRISYAVFCLKKKKTRI